MTIGVYDPAQPTVLLADNIEAPTASDINLSVKRALPRNSGTFTMTYSRRDLQQPAGRLHRRERHRERRRPQRPAVGDR